MKNKFDHEIDRLRSDQRSSSARDQISSDDQLRTLEVEISRARYARDANVDCSREEDGLNVRLRGQPIAVWRAEGEHLTLYRPGCASADMHATDSAQAAVFTARLIAAAWQA